MTDAGLVLLLLGVGILILKSTGPVALGSRTLPAGVARAADLVPAALLSALIVTSGFAAGGQSLTIDARTCGLAAAVVALRLRSPFVVTVALAAFVTALVRLVSP